MKILKLYFGFIVIMSVITLLIVFEEDRSLKNFKYLIKESIHSIGAVSI